MRPTDLNFKHPRDRTPVSYYCPSSLNPSTAKSFGKSERFLQYKEWATRTEKRLGPGIYAEKYKNYFEGRACSIVYVSFHFLAAES